MKNILISQRITSDKFNQIHFSLENKWINYLEKKNVNILPIFTSSNNILNTFKEHKPKLVILSGGSNDVFSNSKANVFRRKIDNQILKICKENRIPILAVCYGFQYIARKFGGKLVKSKQKPGVNHIINIKNRKRINVNSFHNYAVISLPKDFEIIGKHSDDTIEIAFNKKLRILCTMFHPERKNGSQNYINKILKKYLKL
tara:strand:+ start:1016 stop:1618 length:603 start_codon:yes stop_codon:yes gene_type:complete